MHLFWVAIKRILFLSSRIISVDNSISFACDIFVYLLNFPHNFFFAFFDIFFPFFHHFPLFFYFFLQPFPYFYIFIVIICIYLILFWPCKQFSIPMKLMLVYNRNEMTASPLNTLFLSL